MIRFGVAATAALAALWLTAVPVAAKDKVKVGFIGPLTGGVSVNGLGGRNSADLAVKLRNADAKAKYEYELVVLDDACTPNVAVQVATEYRVGMGVPPGAYAVWVVPANGAKAQRVADNVRVQAGKSVRVGD